MFFQFFLILLSKLPFLALHFETAAFKKQLSGEEEKDCLIKMKSGTPKEQEAAREKLIVHNLRLVAHILKKYNIEPSETDEYISIGSIGLIKAVDKFKIEKGKFSTFAGRCIENEILMHLRSVVKNRPTGGLDEPISVDKDGKALTIIDILPDSANVAEEYDTNEEHKLVRLLIDRSLCTRERIIIKMRTGIDQSDGQSLPQREVAKRLNISRSYVSRIEKGAIIKLRKALKDQAFDASNKKR
jgi:RNA polymerase sigma factor, sigma-70 family